MKELSEMSLEELWQLFPITLTPHQDIWDAWYLEEENHLKAILPQNCDVKLHHIGSTAISSIWAKPIVDILMEIPANKSMEPIEICLTQHGYLVMSKEPKRISFNKGYTKEGFAEKIFHLHLRFLGDNDEIKFCKYLNEHPDEAEEYEALKLSLWKQFEHDRDAYTNAKTDFIKKIKKVVDNE